MDKIDNLIHWLVTMLAIALVAGFFLSSGRPAWSMGNARSIEVELSSVWEVGDEPVPFLDWDTSKALDAWYEMFVYQLAFGILSDHIAALEKAEADERLAARRAADSELSNRLFWYVVSFFFAALALLIFNIERAGKWVKRLSIWRKT